MKFSESFEKTEEKKIVSFGTARRTSTIIYVQLKLYIVLSYKLETFEFLTRDSRVRQKDLSLNSKSRYVRRCLASVLLALEGDDYGVVRSWEELETGETPYGHQIRELLHLKKNPQI